MAALEEAIAGAGGAVLAVIISWLLGRSDSARERRVSEIHAEAMVAVEKSEKFSLAGEQKILHEQIARDMEEIKVTVHTVDRKLDDLLLSGRLHVRKPSEP